jgi:hypothetical protein
VYFDHFCIYLAIGIPEVPWEVGEGGTEGDQETWIFGPGKPFELVGQIGRQFGKKYLPTITFNLVWHPSSDAGHDCKADSTRWRLDDESGELERGGSVLFYSNSSLYTRGTNFRR